MSEMPARSHMVAREGDSPRREDSISIFAVIVLYKMQPVASSTLRTLLASLDHLQRSAGGRSVQLRILLADNTPGGQSAPELPERGASPVEYRSFPDNPGLVPVYNLALAEAKQESQWLLTLDQDTHLPPAFLASMAQNVAFYKNDGSIAAIVPRVFDGVRPVSPLRFVAGFPRIVGAEGTGVLGFHASAINSASLLRISALKGVGGYDVRFPLNNSDTALFERLYRAGYRVVLAGDVVVQHEFSMLQREDRMTLERYRQLLRDERDFWDLHMSAMARTERFVVLMGRFAKSYLKRDDQRFRRATLDELRHRIFTSRRERIRRAAAAGEP